MSRERKKMDYNTYVRESNTLYFMKENLSEIFDLFDVIRRYNVLTDPRVLRMGRIRNPHELAWSGQIARGLGIELDKLKGLDNIRRVEPDKEVWYALVKHYEPARKLDNLLDQLENFEKVEERLREEVTSHKPKYSISFKDKSVVVTVDADKAYEECLSRVGGEDIEELLSCVRDETTKSIKEAVGTKEVETECDFFDDTVQCRSRILDFLF